MFFGKKKTSKGKFLCDSNLEKNFEMKEKRIFEKQNAHWTGWPSCQVDHYNREREHLKRQEQQIQAEIKAALKRGDEVTARILAKQVIANRNQQQKLLKMSGTMTGMQYRTTVWFCCESLLMFYL